MCVFLLSRYGHAWAMLLHKKQQSSNVCDYSPIARSVAQSSMDASTREKMKQKFNIAYLMAKEKLAFTQIWHLLVSWKSDMALIWGQGIKMSEPVLPSPSLFVAVYKLPCHQLSKHNFFKCSSCRCWPCWGGALYFDPLSTDGKVHVQNTFLCGWYLKYGMGEGNYERAMQYMEIDNWKTNGATEPVPQLQKVVWRGLLRENFREFSCSGV